MKILEVVLIAIAVLAFLRMTILAVLRPRRLMFWVEPSRRILLRLVGIRGTDPRSKAAKTTKQGRAMLNRSGSERRPSSVRSTTQESGNVSKRESRDEAGTVAYAHHPESVLAQENARLVVGASTRGGPHGKNEDGYLIQGRLFAVADGVGGAGAGGYASQVVLRLIAEASLENARDPVTALESACGEANTQLRELALRDPSLSGMATTLDVALLSPALVDRPITLGHIGNGTIYIHTDKDGPIAVTRPHAAPGGPLLRAVGLSQTLTADVARQTVHVGDRILIVTDGLTHSLPAKSLDDLIRKLRFASPQQAADTLVAAAVEAGSQDDVTVLIVDLRAA